MQLIIIATWPVVLFMVLELYRQSEGDTCLLSAFRDSTLAQQDP
jgi:hypothetical protein